MSGYGSLNGGYYGGRGPVRNDAWLYGYTVGDQNTQTAAQTGTQNPNYIGQAVGYLPTNYHPAGPYQTSFTYTPPNGYSNGSNSSSSNSLPSYSNGSNYPYSWAGLGPYSYSNPYSGYFYSNLPYYSNSNASNTPNLPTYQAWQYR